MTERSPLVLAGAGHAHLVALRRWIQAGWRAPAGTLLLNPTAQAWYSGMMPGLIAGRFQQEDCAIELAPLCAAAGVTLITDSIQALDAPARTLHCDLGPIRFEVLSLNTGSRPPAPAASDGSVERVPAKPFPRFTDVWRQWQDQGSPDRIAILGGGAAAFELALALRQSLPDSALCLVTDRRLLQAHPARLARYARRLLQRRNIDLEEGPRVERLQDGRLWSASRPITTADALVLASGAAPLPWYRDSGLPLGRSGFFPVNPMLQSTADQRIFAAGDCIDLPGALRSGVYAVRQGETLANNLRATQTGGALQAYQPRARSLALLSTADGGALLSYGPWFARGRLAGRWKDALDLGFMQRHRL